MKKKLLLGLTILGAASMLCGFDSAETSDDVLNKMQEASAAIDNMSMEMSMNLDAALNISDDTTTSTLAIAANGDFSCDYTMDPIAMKLDGTMSLSTLGQGEDITMQTYMVTGENGELETYAYTSDSTSGESGWTYDSTDDFNMASIMKLSESFDASAFAEYGLVFDLASEPADVNGTECYLLSTTINTDTLNTMLTKVSEMAGEDLTADEDVSTALAMLTGLQLNIQYSVDAATYLPVALHMDMNGSDVSTLNTLISAMMGSGAEGSTMELVLNDVSVDAAVSYGNVAEITVPQEAIDAVAAGEAESADDVLDDMDDVEDMLESEVAVG